MAQGGYFGWFGSFLAGERAGWGWFRRARARPASGIRFGWRGLFGRASADRVGPAPIAARDAVVRPEPARPHHNPRAPAAPATLIRLQRMRRRAVIDMFDQVGLGPFPGQLWRFVDAERDPYAGIARFFDAIGIEIDRVKRREPGEIERANIVLELLFSIDHVFDRVAPDIAAQLEAHLCSGDYATVERAAQLIQTFEKIARIDQRWPAGERLALLDAFIGDARAGLADPLAVPPALAAHAARVADELVRQMVALDVARAEQARLRGELARHWPMVWNAAAEGRLRLAMIAQADRAVATLLGEAALRHEDVEALLGAIAGANHALQELADRIARAGRGEAAAPARASLSDFDHALAFFGFAADARPDRDALRQRFRELARTMHPDAACAAGDAPADAARAAHDRFVALNRHHEVLKLRL